MLTPIGRPEDDRARHRQTRGREADGVLPVFLVAV